MLFYREVRLGTQFFVVSFPTIPRSFQICAGFHLLWLFPFYGLFFPFLVGGILGGDGGYLVIIVDVSAVVVVTFVVSAVVVSFAVIDFALVAVLTGCFFFQVTWVHPSPGLS